jgi:rhodanese-related sulfurtransferase
MRAMDHAPRFLALVESARALVRETTVDEVLARRARGERFELVDVREDHEWVAGHAAGARHVGRGILERDVERLFPDLDTPIVLYCGGGFRSALSAEALQRMGYRQVVSMAGGFRAWRESGAPEDRKIDLG